MSNRVDIVGKHDHFSDESLFRQLAENLQEVLFLISPDWQIVYYISPAYELIWQKSCESLYAEPMSWLFSLHADDRPIVFQYIEEKMQGDLQGISFPEYRVVRSDGSVKWIKARGFPILDEAGKVYRIAGIATDITDQKEKEQQLLLSEERLKMVLEGSQQGFWDWNIVTGEVQRNEGWAKMLGYTLKEFEANTDTWTDTIHPDDRDAAWASIYNHLEGRTDAHKMEYRMRTKDGGYKWILDQAKIVQRDPSGHPLRMSGTHTDISERVRIEESLRLSQQRLLLHREQSPLGIIEWNSDFELLDWNPAAEKIFGFTKEEVIGKKFFERILPELARPVVRKVWIDLLSGNSGTHSLNENITKDGRAILCEWHNTPLVNSDGNVIGVTSLVEDVTQRQKFEEELRHSQKMDAIGKLTGGIAHDFNNMLTVILGFSELLKAYVGNNDPKLVKYAEEISKAGDRARTLTSKLLEFSHKTPSYASMTHISNSLYGMRHMLEKTLTPRIKLVIDLDADLWPIWVDESRLEDAVLNMCINSMHAMPFGGVLTISSHNVHKTSVDRNDAVIAPGEYVVLSIDDTGVGMTPEVRQKMFDPFFTTKGHGGTGLGMSQVYGFVQQSGGTFRVYSQPGEGTLIEMYFPRYFKSETSKVTAEKGISQGCPTGKESILVVDDEDSLGELTSEILTKYGYTVFRTQSAEQALEVLKHVPVDLLLSDIIMPGMGGYELAAEVESKYPHVKMQLFSGFSDEQTVGMDQQELYERRLQKPFTAEKLLKCIRNMLDEVSVA